MKYRITDITWDLDYYVDESLLNLPSEPLVEVHMDTDATELDLRHALENAVTDSVGFCMFQFDYQIVDDLSGQPSNK